MILQLLKHETRERHAALERQMPLLDANLGLAVYRHMVQKLYTYHEPLERLLLSLSDVTDLGINYAERAKTTRLANDLVALGMCTSDIEQLRPCESLPALDNASRAFGCLYVLEGATLGGQIVARHLQSSLGLTPECGASYFSGYGVHTGPQWKAFCALLTAFAERTDDASEMLAGANATYATLSAWMRVPDDDTAPALRAWPAAQAVLA